MSDTTPVVDTVDTSATPLQLGEHRLGYQRTGQGPDLLFVHGWPLHGATFRRIVPVLAQEYTCHLLDLPGAGASSGPALGFPAQLALLRGAIASLGLQRYALIAHDSGGMLARYIAADDARVAALVLGNTELPGPTPSSIALLSALAKLPGGAELFRAAMRQPVVRHSALGFGACLENRALLSGEFDRLFLQAIFASASATRRCLAALDGYSQLCEGLSAVHARLRAPALLIWGSADKFFPLAGARAMLPEFAASARLETIAHGRLFVHEDHPDEFVSLARPFLREQLADTFKPRAARVASPPEVPHERRFHG
jgi:haloalkane dehalogenase